MDCRSCPNGPKLHLQIRKVSGNVKGEPTRGLHLLPVRTSPIEFEVGRAGMERDLPRSDRQRPYRDPRKRHIHEFAYMLNSADLDLVREQAAKLLARDIGGDGQHE